MIGVVIVLVLIAAFSVWALSMPERPVGDRIRRRR